MSSPRKSMQFLWEEFFRDPSQFCDVRNIKKSCKSPDFRHKHTGNVLWIDGLYNPPWVTEMLKRIELPSSVETDNDHADIIQQIKTCGNKKDISTIRRLHADKGWITEDILIANTLIRSYSKCGAMKEAREIFNQLGKKNVVSWTALIAGYTEQGCSEEALSCFMQMENDGVTPNWVTYACVLKACANVGAFETVEGIHAKVREQRLLNKEAVLGTALVNAYMKCGAIKEAENIFSELKERNVISWSALIAGYVEQGLGEEALMCFRKMQNDRVAPDSVAYACTLKACGIVRDLKTVEEIHAKVRDLGLLNKHVILGTAFVDAYAKCGAVKEAHKIFDQLKDRNVVSWSALIAGYADHGCGEEAITCFREMQNYGVVPDSVAYASALKAYGIVADLATVKEIHALVGEHGLLNKDIVLGNTLVNTYAKCGAVVDAQKVFYQLPQRDIVSWNSLIAGYVDLGLAEKALTCFREMKRHKLTPNSVSYVSILKACSIVGALKTVEEIHALVRGQGLLNENIVLGTALVNAYAKCGIVKETWEIFNQLDSRDVEAWNALLSGCVELGQINEMLKLYCRMMVEGVFPDTVTFLVLLNGCSHGALLEEGKRLFHVFGTYGLPPTQKHYNCIVDLFSRAGCLNKAKDFVVDDAPALMAFLGACKKGVNVDLGKWAFQKLLFLDHMKGKRTHTHV